jgi:hypothetical protein
MTVLVVREVDYDGGKIGRCWRFCVCANKDAAGRVIELFTKPISYRDGERKFEPHVHREDRETIIGYRGPIPTFVYIEEKEILE